MAQKKMSCGKNKPCPAKDQARSEQQSSYFKTRSNANAFIPQLPSIFGDIGTKIRNVPLMKDQMYKDGNIPPDRYYFLHPSTTHPEKPLLLDNRSGFWTEEYRLKNEAKLKKRDNEFEFNAFGIEGLDNRHIMYDLHALPNVKNVNFGELKKNQ